MTIYSQYADAKLVDLLKSGDRLAYEEIYVRNHLLNQIARKDIQGRYIASIKSFAEENTVITDHRVRENQLKEFIDREIAALPPRTREVFELSRKQHLTYREIAEQLGTSEETVKNRYQVL